MKTRKLAYRILLGLAIGVITSVVGYIIFVSYVIYNMSSGCGWDDGPFSASIIKSIEINKGDEIYHLSDNGQLIVTLPTDNSNPPILTLKENGIKKWSLKMEMNNNENHTNNQIYNITNLKFDKKQTQSAFHFLLNGLMAESKVP